MLRTQMMAHPPEGENSARSAPTFFEDEFCRTLFISPLRCRRRPQPICQGKTRRENFTRFVRIRGYGERLRDSPISELRNPFWALRVDRVSLPPGIRNDLRKMAVINCASLSPSFPLLPRSLTDSRCECRFLRGLLKPHAPRTREGQD